MGEGMDWDRTSLLESRLLYPLHPAIEKLRADGFPALDDWNGLLECRDPAIVVRNGLPLRFVAQAHGKLPFEEQYEPRCFLKGEVQTRERNWHDLFNALVWLTFPRAKAAINARHFQALTTARKDDAASQRGAVRDMNTLFDESGVIVACADPELEQMLRGFRWHELFWVHRAEVEARMDFHVFGHGLHEKCLRPYVGLTGQGLVVAVDEDYFGWPLERRLEHLDERVAAYLDDPGKCLDTAELTPVPLLGIPGWSDDNRDEAYYANTDYFRPGRRKKPVDTP